MPQHAVNCWLLIAQARLLNQECVFYQTRVSEFQGFYSVDCHSFLPKIPTLWDVRPCRVVDI